MCHVCKWASKGRHACVQVPNCYMNEGICGEDEFCQIIDHAKWGPFGEAGPNGESPPDGGAAARRSSSGQRSLFHAML